MNAIAYQAARENVALFDLSDRTKLEVRGQDRAAFLHNFCTNDIVKLPLWHGCEAFLTTAQAKLVAYFTAFQLPEAIWIDADPGLADKIITYLERFHISEDVGFADHTTELAQLLVAGPQSGPLLDRLTGNSVSSFCNLQHHTQGWRRTDRLAIPGFELLGPQSQVEGVRQSFINAGAAVAERDVYETLRIEAGTPEYGRDIDESNLPQEVNRTERAISFTKGCYVGQETVARIRAYGHVNRLLVGLKLDGPEPAAADTKFWHGDQEVGKITSSTFSPVCQTGIALGYVRRAQSTPGTRLELATAAGRRDATVTTLPFS